MQLRDNLIAYFSLDAVGTRSILDHSGFGNHLEHSGMAAGGVMDGANSTANSWPNQPELKRLNDFSVGFDVVMDSTASTQMLLCYSAPLSNNRAWRIYWSGAGEWRFEVSLDGTNIVQSVIAGPATAGQSYRLFARYNGHNVAFSVDGASNGEVTNNGGDLFDPGSNATFELGAYTGIINDALRLSGSIQNLHVWDAYVATAEKDVFQAGWNAGKTIEGTVNCVTIAGQSNAEGKILTIPADSLVRDNRRRSVMYSEGSRYGRSKSITHAHYDIYTNDTFGPEIGVANALPGAEQWLVHKYALEATSLHTDWAPSGPQLTAWKTSIAEVNADLLALELTPNWRIIYWDQGSADALATEADATQYADRFAVLLADMRATLNNANAVAVLNVIHADSLAYGPYVYAEEVKASQLAAIAADALVVGYNQDKLTLNDHVHRDYGSQYTAGFEGAVLGYEAAKGIYAVPSVSQIVAALNSFQTKTPTLDRDKDDQEAIRFSWPSDGATVTGQVSFAGGAYQSVAGAITQRADEGAVYWYQLAYHADDRQLGTQRYKFTDGTNTQYVNLRVGSDTEARLAKLDVTGTLANTDNAGSFKATITGGAISISSPVPTATTIQLVYGDTYDGSSGDKLSWTVDKDLTGNTIKLVITSCDFDTTYLTATGTVESATEISVSMDAIFDPVPTFPDTCNASLKLAFALVSIDGDDDEETIARGSCYVYERGVVA